uniref:Uncharacterized protein n=1 Tax=Rhizophora mucronata TaxID=61149 RepID=A0A2P2PAE2_RHIMU
MLRHSNVRSESWISTLIEQEIEMYISIPKHYLHVSDQVQGFAEMQSTKTLYSFPDFKLKTH